MGFIETVRYKSRHLKQELLVLYYAFKNSGTPLLPRILILLALGYALSPIDVIPDFIPVLGYLDDLLLIPLLISMAIAVIPHKVIEESREQARIKPLHLKTRWYGAVLVIIVWLLVGTVIAVTLFKA